MPEPDFDQIARDLLGHGVSIERVAAQLRLVWNARGAADIKKLETELSPEDDGTMTAGRAFNMKSLDRALRTLDR